MVTEVCGVNGDIFVSLCSAPSSGVQDNAVLINKSDIKGWTSTTGVVDGKVKIFASVQYKFARRGYLLTGRNNSNAPTNNFDGSGAIGSYTQGFDFTYFGDNPETVTILSEMNAGRTVAIFETNNERFKIAGRQSGLVVQTATQEVNSDETGGGYRIACLAKANTFMDYLGVYTGVSPNKVFDYDATLEAFDNLTKTQFFTITNITVGATTRITLDNTEKPSVLGVEIGTKVRFKDIIGTVGTDATNGLNGKEFVISEIYEDNVFTITANTTALVYTSGGMVR